MLEAALNLQRHAYRPINWRVSLDKITLGRYARRRWLRLLRLLALSPKRACDGHSIGAQSQLSARAC